VIILRRMRWVGNVAHMEESKNGYRVFLGNLKGRDLFENLDVDEKIKLKQILKKWNGRPWT
jgi:hypothetical protein